MCWPKRSVLRTTTGLPHIRSRHLSKAGNLQKLMEVAGQLAPAQLSGSQQLLEELVPEIRSASLFVTVVAKENCLFLRQF